MIHPLKAATSFECDGCGHHASFHKMDNRQDEEYERQWKSQQQTLDTDQASQQTVRPSAATRVGSQGPERNGVKGFEIIEKMLRLNDDESAAGRASKKRRITAR